MRVVARLRESGHAAYLAGGCVRDELLGAVPKDYDVATDARPERIAEIFRPRTSAVGAAFGVVLVKERGCVTEVATFRADGPYSDKRRPDHVEFATPLADAQRRDFTINAMFLDPLAADDAARVIDFVGGRADIASRTLRAVGNADQRLAEDHLRALRAVRFAARYGLSIEASTASAIAAHARELSGVSRERIGDEIRRMLAHPERGRAASLMGELGLTGPATAGVLTARGVPTLTALPQDASAMLALAAWVCDALVDERSASLPADASRVTAGLRRALLLSNEESAALRGILDCAHELVGPGPGSGVASRKRAHARGHAPEAIVLLGALDGASARGTCGANGTAARVRAERERLTSDGIGIAPVPLLDGDALVAAGYAPGPGFARLLAAVYDAQLEGGVRTPDAAITLADELAPRHGVARRARPTP